MTINIAVIMVAEVIETILIETRIIKINQIEDHTEAQALVAIVIAHIEDVVQAQVLPLVQYLATVNYFLKPL